MKFSTTHFAVLACVTADVRLNFQQEGLVNKDGVYAIPSTFGIKGIIEQKDKNNDQFLRSNIDNEANKRDTSKEIPMDMLPCRQDSPGKLMKFRKDTFYELPLRWNNPHDSDFEVNIWTNGMSVVTPIRMPANCGGGYKDQRHSFKIPEDFQGCTNENENCRLQIYIHSVEPRTYAVCIDFVISDTAPAGIPAALTQPDKDIPSAKPQPAVHYSDSFDTSHIDSQYSGYRGQQPDKIRPNLRAAITIQSYLGNGGLVGLGNFDKDLAKDMRNKVQEDIKAAEADAIRLNKEEQEKRNEEAKATKQDRKCFEGDLYGVVLNKNCKREYTNTYVTNVDYVKIQNEWVPKFIAAGLFQYTPTLKNVIGNTPVDPYGPFKVNGKPSLVPKDSEVKGAEVLPAPAKGQGFPPVQVTYPIAGIALLYPPLAPDFKTGPPNQGGAGNGGSPGQPVPAQGTTGERLPIGVVLPTASNPVPQPNFPPVTVESPPKATAPSSPNAASPIKYTAPAKCIPRPVY